MTIRPYLAKDENTVIELWRRCGLLRPWNNPVTDIERKSRVSPEMFLVGLVNGRIVATVMGGYDGHRGWINYLAVNPEHHRKGLGTLLMREFEKKIQIIGYPKINIQIRTDNPDAMTFYESIGYQRDEVVSMGKRLVHDDVTVNVE